MTRPRGFHICLALAIVVCWSSPLQAGDAVPVLLWGTTVSPGFATNGANPFVKTSKAEFGKIVDARVQRNPVVVFVKDSLCAEDFTQNKEDLQRITSDGSLAYLPAVEAPLSVFEALSSYNQTLEEDTDSIPEGQLSIRPVSDLSGLSDAYASIKEATPNVVAALTGRSCGYSRSERVRREAPATNSSALIIRDLNLTRVLLYSSQGPFLKTPEDDSFVQLTGKPTILDFDSSKGADDISLKLVFNSRLLAPSQAHKIELEFQFATHTPGYYTLDAVYYNPNSTNSTLLRTDSDVVFPYNFSYHCSQSTVFYNESYGVHLNLTDLQVQIDADSFDDAYDCVGFTTIPIWTGIFVTAILGIIMIWALTMILDVRTMDRFDDPKGKTITISAQE